MAEPREMGVTLCVGRCLELRQKSSAQQHSLIALAERKEAILFPVTEVLRVMIVV
jgi:hypothetical protein